VAVNASNAALDPIELEPVIGSPALGGLLDIQALRTWRVAKFPLLWCYVERGDHVDVVRLPGERRCVAALLGIDHRGSRRSRAHTQARSSCSPRM
jgi:toxin ParE1/3/4